MLAASCHVGCIWHNTRPQRRRVTRRGKITTSRHLTIHVRGGDNVEVAGCHGASSEKAKFVPSRVDHEYVMLTCV